MTEEVILVDQDDRVLGTMEKLEAHRTGVLHRAFSVFLFNSKNELLLQQRALDKYHSAGLWSNTCCSHPRPGEDSLAAANRRLQEEMGLAADLTFISKLAYKTRFDNGLFEHELDYIYVGKSDALPTINPEEANGFKYLPLQQIKTELKHSPQQYTVWFKLAFPQIEQFCKLADD
ncbi:isopentenyl-diphosphate Delta-isomerase [Albibacterium indicum]|uniref:isopentenyl-diphosphate Delta-isomerase n=1 Tax=Albibacterium indicum TaxID=2292082 RepID=UPI000E52FFB4|nr:isopentenyl-diphosphate Delta-isomerase [Pedobacter indicus]